MPLPKPKPNESESSFISRCMSDSTMEDEYPDEGQRLAICNSLWEENRSIEFDTKLKEALQTIKREMDEKK